MKKIDKLVLGAFLGLFVLTFFVGFFVLLMQFLLTYLDRFIGKGLGWGIYLQLFSYFAIIATKQAFPLATLLASIMAMGNLGQHHELTALKSAGISLPRVLSPLFVFVCLLGSLALFSNSYLVPRANLDVISLLHDLSKKKPSVAIKEGVFYDDIPGYSIKIRKKLEDQKTLQGIMVYDHTQDRGNVSLTIAESGKLYTIRNESYLVLELFNGHNYIEEASPKNTSESNDIPVPPLYRSNFKAQKLLLSLDSFKLSRSKKELFENFYRTKNASQLAADVREMQGEIKTARQSIQSATLKNAVAIDEADSVATTPLQETLLVANILKLKAYAVQRHQAEEGGQDATTASEGPSTLYEAKDLVHIYDKALEQAKASRKKVVSQIRKEKRLRREIIRHDLERHQMMAWAATCIVIFLVGAPLGAIIKKGGLGVPLVIATALIVWHYIFSMLGEKWARAGIIDPFSGAWLANFLLLPFGIFFFIQAYRDARLLEADFYAVLLERMKKRVSKVRGLFRRSGH
ncbi:MAG: LptF/LptG family permease [Bacteroidota bacterium]